MTKNVLIFGELVEVVSRANGYKKFCECRLDGNLNIFTIEQLFANHFNHSLLPLVYNYNFYIGFNSRGGCMC